MTQDKSMSAKEFTAWLEAMKEVGLARSDAECGRLLGVSANTVVTLKAEGADERTRLACHALWQRLDQPPTWEDLGEPDVDP